MGGRPRALRKAVFIQTPFFRLFCVHNFTATIPRHRFSSRRGVLVPENGKREKEIAIAEDRPPTSRDSRFENIRRILDRVCSKTRSVRDRESLTEGGETSMVSGRLFFGK